jgi:predicted small lipoprotein YifL
MDPMLRLPSAAQRSVIALAAALAVSGCGIKGPLVPAKNGAEAPPPAATTAPTIPSATLPANPQPAP